MIASMLSVEQLIPRCLTLPTNNGFWRSWASEPLRETQPPRVRPLLYCPDLRPDARRWQARRQERSIDQLEISPEDEPHCLGFALVDEQLPVFEPVAERNRPAHPHALALGCRNLVADALAGDLALELGKRQQHVEREPPHARGRVERLRDAHERGAGFVERLDDAREVGEAAGEPIDLVDNDDVDLACGDVGKSCWRAGLAMFPPDQPPSS